MELTDVASVTTLLPTVSMVDPDVILLDLALTGPDPADTVRRVHRSAPKVPLIVLANADREAEAARCLEVGAIDCLLKGLITARTIELAVRKALERNTLSGLTDLMRDPLTALYTRNGLMTLGARAMETARQRSSTLVLLCARLENLPSLREDFGARNAEQILKELGELLSGSFRGSDVVARAGEALFVVLAVDAVSQSAPVLMQRVQRRLNTLNQLRDAAGGMQVRMAVGLWSAHEKRTFAELLDSVEVELRTDREVSRKESELPVSTAG